MVKKRPYSFLWQWDEPADQAVMRAEAWDRGSFIYLRVVDLRTGETVKSFRACPVSYAEHFGEVWLMKLQAYLKKMAAQTVSTAKKGRPADPAWEKRYPLLYALLTDNDGGDGRTRALSKVSIWTEPHAFKASVSEPDGAVSAYCSHPTLEGLLDALEARLLSDEPDVWVPWSGNFKKGKKR